MVLKWEWGEPGMPQGRWQWVIHSLCVGRAEELVAMWEIATQKALCLVFAVESASTQLYAVKRVRVLSTCWSAASLTLLSSLTAEGAGDFWEVSGRMICLGSSWDLPSPFLLPRPLHPRHAAEQLPRAGSKIVPWPLPATVALGPYGKAVKQMFISHGLALGSPKLTLLQLWLPWIRMLRPRKGRELAKTHNWGLESPVSSTFLYAVKESSRLKSSFTLKCSILIVP